MMTAMIVDVKLPPPYYLMVAASWLSRRFRLVARLLRHCFFALLLEESVGPTLMVTGSWGRRGGVRRWRRQGSRGS